VGGGGAREAPGEGGGVNRAQRAVTGSNGIGAC